MSMSMKICVNIDLTEEIGKLFLGTKSLHLEMHLENFSLIFSNVIWWIESQKRTPLHNNNNFFFSVRDLLRALRNKKHHYNELPEVTKLMYGRLPDQFTDYWTSRFPKLLIHSWMSMHCIKNEPSLAKYFDKDYDFVKVILEHLHALLNIDQ